jgi:flagellar hook-length control protein FliK
MAAVALPSSLNANAAAPAAPSNPGSKPVNNNNKPAQAKGEGTPRSFARELHKAVDGDANAKAEAKECNADAAKDEELKAQTADGEGTGKAANAAVDPAALLPGWQPLNPDRPTAAAGDTLDGAEAADTAVGDALPAAPKGGERHLRLARDKAAVSSEASASESGSRHAAATEEAGQAAGDAGREAALPSASADTSAVAAEPATSTGTHELAALHAAGPAHGSTAQHATELSSAANTSAPAPFEAQLSAALGSPEFAPALGVQMSILAKEGVQEARLHLNPADMGPIAVQIAVDGQHARVHFQADLAATRDALQASLPDLASAMREAGLMLAGGDVSGGGARGGGASGSPGDTAAADRSADITQAISSPAQSAARTVRAQGVVDLYA